VLVEGHIPQQSVEEDVEAATRREAVIEFMKRHPGVCIESIDGEMIRGLCESCSKPIMESDTEFNYDSEGVYWCKDDCET